MSRQQIRNVAVKAKTAAKIKSITKLQETLLVAQQKATLCLNELEDSSLTDTMTVYAAIQFGPRLEEAVECIRSANEYISDALECVNDARLSIRNEAVDEIEEELSYSDEDEYEYEEDEGEEYESGEYEFEAEIEDEESEDEESESEEDEDEDEEDVAVAKMPAKEELALRRKVARRKRMGLQD